ncbi:uncharacterized protein LOC126886242 [Diabrotica virgifera virgifera]|uniref:Uncharacterized protein n=1 Tax=Diabrotica virgifera virgifera TaxID=50390 RepID=A0ABM5KFU2_DIAVI|nr:uncharacterized protein LOC126886242 [Diabrotica virgifera virgifera]
MSEAIDKLRKNRNSVKINLIIFSKFVDNFNTADGSVTELQARLNNAKHLIREFEDIQREIEASLDQVSEEEINHRIEFNSLYYSTVTSAELIINNSSSTCEHNSSSAQQSTNIIGITLPSLHLQKFSGSYDQWFFFRDSFEAIIIQNKNISDIQKYHYLKSCVSGSAEKVIQSLTVSSSNFIVAWNLLLDRFENKELLIHNHIKSMFNIKQIKENSSSSLRYLVDTITSNLRSLQSLKEPVDKWDSLLTYIVLEKLDADIAHDWEKNKTKNSSFQDFMTFLSNKANVLEKIEQSTNHVRHSSDKSQCSSHSSNKSFKTRSFVTNQSATFSCAFCRGDHKIYTCEEFLKLNVHSRIEEVKKRSLCLNCLHVGHISSTCKYGKCKHCKRKHHSILHIETSEVSIPSTSHINSQTSLSNYTNVQNKGVLLSTVKVQVFDQHNKAHSCKAILDSGSQSNFDDAPVEKHEACLHQIQNIHAQFDNSMHDK